LLTKLFSKSPWRRAAQAPGQVMSYGVHDKPEESIQTILPGETGSYSFKALVPRWLFITGTDITFEGSIKYKYKDETHSSHFRVKFSVRPPLISNINGAIFGGILGTTAKYLRDIGASNSVTFDLSFFSASALAVILGVIMVVFSSRRTGDVQPILTIEDIWGGMLAGFLVGYLGHDFFGKVVNI
jgi:hypothetical protein